MSKLLAKKVNQIRNPFSVEKLSLMAKLCRCWFDNQIIRKKRGKAKFARTFFVMLNKWGVKSEGIFNYKINSQTIPIKFNARNTQFSSIYSRRYSEAYEAEIASLIDLLFINEGVFYDIGANFGYFSLYLASRPDFKGGIYSFEPNPDTFADLQTCIKQAKLENKINPYCLAAHSVHDVMYVKPSGVRSGNFHLGDKTNEKINAHEVKLAPLDDLNLPLPNFIKIDTDGCELEVLKGCKNILTKSKPSIVIESVIYSGDTKKTIEPLFYLKQNNYVFFYIGWIENLNDSNKAIWNEEQVKEGHRKTLGLSMIEIEQRPLFAERLNLLAVHKDKLEELKVVFSEC